MDTKTVLLLCLAFALSNAISISKTIEEQEVDDIVAALQGEQTASSWNPAPEVVNVFPYEAAQRNVFGSTSVGFHKPATTLGFSTAGIFAAQSEVLRLIEAFLQLKGQVASHLFALFNNNFELFRSVANFLIAKIPHLHAFALKGVSVLRKILEFAVHTFAEWNISLPSINFGASQEAYVQTQPQPQPQIQLQHQIQPQPHPFENYGVPSLDVASFLETVKRK